MQSTARKEKSTSEQAKILSLQKQSRAAELRDEEEYAYFKSKGTAQHDEGEGSWLVSYADMMTLLVGFFVMLFSMSKIDSGEFEKIKRETTKVFGGEYQKPFEKLSSELKKVIEEQKLGDQVFLQESEAGILLTFRGALFFDSASAELREQANGLLEKLVPTIASNSQDMGIIVEGHTDDRPIVSKIFASNWELSSVRACTVLRFFLEKGFNPDKIKAIGYGDRRPILPNTDKSGKSLADNQSQNRRVVIQILKNFD